VWLLTTATEPRIVDVLAVLNPFDQVAGFTRMGDFKIALRAQGVVEDSRQRFGRRRCRVLHPRAQADAVTAPSDVDGSAWSSTRCHPRHHTNRDCHEHRQSRKGEWVEQCIDARQINPNDSDRADSIQPCRCGSGRCHHSWSQTE
jgi:hypothetical protein